MIPAAPAAPPRLGPLWLASLGAGALLTCAGALTFTAGWLDPWPAGRGLGLGGFVAGLLLLGLSLARVRA